MVNAFEIATYAVYVSHRFNISMHMSNNMSTWMLNKITRETALYKYCMFICDVAQCTFKRTV